MLKILVRRPLILVLLAVLPAFAGNVDSQIHQVKTIFVAGNNDDAATARKILAKGKTCLALGSKVADSDAVLFVVEAQLPSGLEDIPGSSGATKMPSQADLKLKSGAVVWSKSDFFDGKDLMRLLARDICGESSGKGK